MQQLSMHHPAVWALAILGATLTIVGLLVARHQKDARKIYDKHFGDNRPRERLLYASLAFSVTFAIVRILTHAIHAGTGPFHDVWMAGRHIHHLVWGILLLLLVAYGWMWQPTRHERALGIVLSVLYGLGAALTLDEFALWLNLRDVYWEREGRASIDAVVLFSGLLGTGVFGGRFLHELGRFAFGRG